MSKQLDILTEAVSRSLNIGMLTTDLPLNIAQKEALQKYVEFLAQPHDESERRRAYFDMATGTGKTGLFSVIARNARQVALEWGHGEHFKIIIIEPTIQLLGQTRDKLVQTAPELVRSIGIYGGGSKELREPVTIATYDAWLELLESDQLPKDALYINDEAHHTLSTRRQNLINNHLTEALQLGFTASAQYDTDKTLELTHRNLIHRLSLPDAVERGLLTDYIHVQFAIVQVTPSLTERKNEQSKRLQSRELRLLKRREWSKLVTRAYATMNDTISGQPLSDKIATFFAADTHHADALAEMLNENAILQRKAKMAGFKDVAVSIHSIGHSPVEQARRLEAFQGGEYMAAVGDEKFKMGFDYDRVKFIASYPRGSLVDTIQELGRATRRYADPVTGELQGTVTLETIPYIGDADSKKDAKSREEALARSITALDVIRNRSFIFSQERKQGVRGPNGPRKPMILSPGVTAEVYVTEEETLTVSNQITKAREGTRIPFTAAMHADLISRIEEKGNFRPERLIEEVQQYENRMRIDSIGLKVTTIHNAIYGNLGSVDVHEWQRLLDVIDALPVVEREHRVQITPEMLGDFKAKLLDRGELGSKKLIEALEPYQNERQLPDVGLNAGIIQTILDGTVKSARVKHWERLNELVDSLPVIPGGHRIPLTPAMIAELNSEIEKRGGYKPVRLYREVQSFENDRSLSDNGLSVGIIHNIIRGSAETAIEAQWERLKQVVAAIPIGGAKPRVVLTDEVIDQMQEKIEARGNYGARRLIQQVQRYEFENNLPSTGLNENTITASLRGYPHKTVDAAQWQRLNDAVDAIPLGGTWPKVTLTDSLIDNLKEKISEHGNFGAPRLLRAVKSYEAAQGIPSVGLTIAIIGSVIAGRNQQIDQEQWQVLNEAIDALPLMPRKRISLTPTMKEELRGRIAIFGDYHPVRYFLREIRQYEREHGLTSTDITKTVIWRLLSDRCNTVEQARWSRLQEVFNDIDLNGAKNIRIELSQQAIVDLRLKMQSKGGYGSHRLEREITRYETERGLESSEIDESAIRGILGAASKTVYLPWLRRIHDVLDSIPNGGFESQSASLPRGRQLESIESLIPTPIKKVLGIAIDDKVKGRSSIAEALGYAAITDFVHEWTTETPEIKGQRNTFIEKRYAEISPIVEAMIQEGKNIQEITRELNEAGLTHDTLTGQPIKWEPALLLRGALLTDSHLPLEAFSFARNTVLDKSTRASKEQRPTP